jgi:hypothetical protein
MENYAIKLMEMADLLKNDPTVVVLYYNIFPGAAKWEVDSVSESIGFQIEPCLEKFFFETNGFQLRWIYKSNPKYDPAVHYFHDEIFTDMDIRDWYLPDDGVINILPVRDIFINDNWEDIIWSKEDQQYERVWAGKTFNLFDLMKSIRPFDIFSKERCMAFQVDQETKKNNVVLLQSHYANVSDSKIIDFNTYMDFLVTKLGIVKERKIFSC